MSAFTDPFLELRHRFFLPDNTSSGERGGRKVAGMIMQGSITYSPLIELFSLKRDR